MIKKCTLALKEFEEGGSNEVYDIPEWPQHVSGNWTRSWFDKTKVCQNSTAFLADNSLPEGRMGTDLRETLTFLMCADCSIYLCIFRQFSALFGSFFTFRIIIVSGANEEVACHSQEQLKPCDLVRCVDLHNNCIQGLEGTNFLPFKTGQGLDIKINQTLPMRTVQCCGGIIS